MTTAYTYQLVRAGSIAVIRSDGALISGSPNDPFSADYLAWVEAGNTPTPPSSAPAKPPPTQNQLAAEIDALVANIYSQWTRFQAEYEARLAAAQAFKTAGYQGDPGVWITSYAASAAKGYQDAADTILAQASNLQNALEQLGALRMRKYEVINAPDAPTAQATYNSIVASINQVAATLD
jgi:hypothetical protein